MQDTDERVCGLCGGTGRVPAQPRGDSMAVFVIVWTGMLIMCLLYASWRATMLYGFGWLIVCTTAAVRALRSPNQSKGGS